MTNNSDIITSNILGVNVAVTDMDSTIKLIDDNIDLWRGKYICVANVHTTIMAHDDESYKTIQNSSVLTIPDGSPLSMYSRAEGFADAKRVTGPDLMKEMLKRGYRHFFYGSTDRTIEMLANILPKKYPNAEITGMVSPPFRKITEDEDEEYIKQINDAEPDFVWVGLGAPKQERWMYEHVDKINAIMIGVGAAFDYECGNIKRAPKWMQKLSLEWLYRLMQDPKRLFKRYVVTNIKFLWLTRHSKRK